MKRLWVALFIFPSMALAEIGSLQVDQYRSFNNDPLPKQLITFSSDADARAAINRIMQYTGLPPRFKIMAADVPNAAAIIRGNQRYILYNQFFMSQIKNATQNQWAQISILAHEIGHHLSSHTLEESGSRPRLELEADMFSGHVLQRMGASIEDAVAAMKQVADENGSRTHPPRRSRIAAIANDWKQAQEQNSGRQTENPIPFKRESTPQPAPPRGAVTHTHNGRSHSHPLPAEGIDHQHNGGTATANPVSTPRSTPNTNLPSTINLANNLQLVRIPAGSFQMGRNSGDGQLRYDYNYHEYPAHIVTIPRAFWMGKTEITFEQYNAYTVATNKQKSDDQNLLLGWDNNHPVINIDWYEAQNYTKWLSKNNDKNLNCRLPSEAEWEYAALAGSRSQYSWGDDIGKNNANCEGCGSRWEKKKPAPVASFSANRFGLHDMHGNVNEWTQDLVHDSYYGAPEDGSAWQSDETDSGRITRGGSWTAPPYNLRATFRRSGHPDISSLSTGFRIVCTLPSVR